MRITLVRCTATFSDILDCYNIYVEKKLRSAKTDSNDYMLMFVISILGGVFSALMYWCADNRIWMHSWLLITGIIFVFAVYCFIKSRELRDKYDDIVREWKLTDAKLRSERDLIVLLKTIEQNNDADCSAGIHLLVLLMLHKVIYISAEGSDCCTLHVTCRVEDTFLEKCFYIDNIVHGPEGIVELDRSLHVNVVPYISKECTPPNLSFSMYKKH